MTNSYKSTPTNGFYGRFGGAYVPEILHKCVTDLQQAYLPIIESEEFKKEYHHSCAIMLVVPHLYIMHVA